MDRKFRGLHPQSSSDHALEVPWTTGSAGKRFKIAQIE